MNMPAHKIVNLDCRGMRCPEPILAIAKATRDLRGEPGQLLISADDDAFPGDLKSWARSAHAQIVALTPDGQLHQATILVNAHKVASPMAPTTLPAPPHPAQAPSQTGEKKLLNCLGMKCPEQVIALAKLAKHSPPGQLIEIQADDETFAMDLKSWTRSAKALILSMDSSPSRCIATIQLAGGHAPTSIAPRHTTPPPTSAQATQVQAQPTPTTQTQSQLKLDLRADSTPQQLERLAGLVQAQLPADTTIELLLSRQDSLPQITSWLVQHQHQLVQVHTDALPLRLIIRTGPPMLNMHMTPLEPAPLSAGPGDLAPASQAHERCTLMVRHGDLDSLLSTMLLAHSAASRGLSVEIFFYAAAIRALLAKQPPQPSRLWRRLWPWAKAFATAAATPTTTPTFRLTRIGRRWPQRRSDKKRLATLEQLIQAAIAHDIRFKICTSSMPLLGLRPQDLVTLPNMELVEDDTYIESAKLGLAL